MKKILYLGTMPEWSGNGRSKIASGIFLKAKIDDGKFSISGVIGPLSSGNARGSCGQIESSIREALDAGEITFAPEWNADSVRRLLAVWDSWHLNDMKAACEHQRANGWEEIAGQKVTIYQWKLKPEISKKQNALKQEAIERAASTESAALGFGPEEKRILKLDYTIKTTTPELEGYNVKYYEAGEERGYFAHKEEKMLGWLNQEEHPAGILSKPCEVCGYKYGSAWLKVELPPEVINYLESLPEASKTPAWV